MSTLLESLREQIMAVLPETPVFMIASPEEPKEAVLLSPYEGEVSEYLPIAGEKIQVKVRAENFPRAEGLAWRIFSKVAVAPPESVERKLFSVVPLQPPTYLGVDDDGRSVFVFNLKYMTLWKDV